jgi:type IV secretion system protein VirB5
VAECGWPLSGCRLPVAFALNLVLQVAALAWFELPRLRKLLSMLASTCVQSRVRYRMIPIRGGPHERALRTWLDLCRSVQAEATSWRRAAFASTALSALLGTPLAWVAVRQSVTPYIVEVDRVQPASAVNSAMQPVVPSDAQIAFFLARFIGNVRSLSLDPVVVRTNWFDALDYVSEGAGQTLDRYAHEAAPFARIGAQAVTVELIYVVRASADSFEMRWRERSYQGGTLTRTESFTAVATIAVNAVAGTNPNRNPIGLYIRALDWVADLSPHRT